MYDCATAYTEEVFETASDNLRRERKRKVSWQEQSNKKVRADGEMNSNEMNSSEDDGEMNSNELVSEMHASWEFDGSPPSWLSKAMEEYKSSTSEPRTKAIHWKIVNVSDRDYLLTFLTKGEFLSLHGTFGSAITGWKTLTSAAERCLQTLAKLDSNQLLSIGRIIEIEGVRGAIKQALYLVGSATESEKLGLDEDDNDNNNDNEGKNAAPVALLEEGDCKHTDVCYIFNLLRYCCEMLDKGITQRNNSERDIDIAIKTHIFSCLDSILDKHYGEIVSRASRDRRALGIGASKNVEGYHVDWLFTRHDLAKESAWGREFSLCERAGSSVDNRQKISSDTLKVQKTLRDMHQSLYDAITDAGNGVLSKSVLGQTTKLLMPGFISSYFSVRALLVVYVGAGFYASLDLAEFSIPTTTMEIRNILNVARILLQIKKIMGTTVTRFRKMKEKVNQERFDSEGVVVFGHRSQEPTTPKKEGGGVTKHRNLANASMAMTSMAAVANAGATMMATLAAREG